MKIKLTLIVYLSVIIKGVTQPFPYVNTHKNIDTLNDCVLISDIKKEKKIHDYFSFKELFKIIKIEQTKIDTIAFSKNYILDSIQFETSTHDSFQSTVICYYKYSKKYGKILITRKFCSKYDSNKNSCSEIPNFIFSTPLLLSSYDINEYLAYKTDLRKNFSDFKLKNCLVVSGGKNRIWYIKEIFENQDFSIIFKLRCKKAKEKEDGFHCKKCSNFGIDIGYTENHIERITNK